MRSTPVVIDFHVHLAAREDLTPPAAAFCDGFWEGRGDWDELLTADRFDAYLEAEGVDYAVGLSELNPLAAGVIPNEELCRRFVGSRRLILFGNLNPALTSRLDREAEHLAGLGFRGINLYPGYQYFSPEDPRLYPLYGTCLRLGLPVMVHTGSSVFPGARTRFGDPLLLDGVAVDFPDLPLVLAHAGRGFWYDRAATLARRHPNVYLDVGGLPPQKLLAYFPDLERLHPKVVFGSDWPGNPGIRHNLDALADLPLSVEARRAILGGNAARLLGVGERPNSPLLRAPMPP